MVAQGGGLAVTWGRESSMRRGLVLELSFLDARFRREPGTDETVPATLSQYQIPSFLHPTDCVSTISSFRAVFPADLRLPGLYGSADRPLDQCAQFRAPRRRRRKGLESGHSRGVMRDCGREGALCD